MRDQLPSQIILNQSSEMHGGHSRITGSGRRMDRANRKGQHPTQAADETPQERAAPRWKAVEAFNGIPSLSPAARRVGIALICHMDAQTRECYPGELRLSGALDLWPSAVKKAKADLLEAGLINWTNPNGPRGKSVYTFNWDALIRYSEEAKARGELATQERKFAPAQKPLQRTIKEPHQRTLGNDDLNSKVLKSQIQSPQNSFQSPHQRIHKDLSRGPEHTHRSTQLDITQHNTPSQRNGGMGATKELIEPFVSNPSPPEQAESKKKESGDSIKRRRRKPTATERFFEARMKIVASHFPELVKQIVAYPDGVVRLCQLDKTQQKYAAELLAVKGPEAAKKFVFGCTW